MTLLRAYEPIERQYFHAVQQATGSTDTYSINTTAQ